MTNVSFAADAGPAPKSHADGKIAQATPTSFEIADNRSGLFIFPSLNDPQI
jgi:hypothetical protein